MEEDFRVYPNTEANVRPAKRLYAPVVIALKCSISLEVDTGLYHGVPCCRVPIRVPLFRWQENLHGCF